MKERDGFKSRTGFVLACIGSAVGMGNIWRFPYIVSDWGGMTFLLPYLMFVVLIASTGRDRGDGAGTCGQERPHQGLWDVHRASDRKETGWRADRHDPGSGLHGAGNRLYSSSRLDFQVCVSGA